MAFCGKCGNKVEQGDAFCSSCGTRTNSNSDAGKNSPSTSSFHSPEEDRKDAAKLVQFFSGGIAALSIIALLTSDMLGLIISIGLIAGIHLGAYKPLKRGEIQSAATACIICAGIAAAIGLLALISGNGLIGLLDIAAAIPGFMAWKSMKNK